MSLSRLASQHAARRLGAVNSAATVVQPDRDDRFDLLTKYIPTETLTLFVAAMSAEAAISAVSGGRIGALELYWSGAVLTPVILALAAYGKERAAGVTTPFRPHPWPLVASFIAYLIWALSVPGVLTDPNEKVLAGFGAVLISTVLALLETVAGPRPRASQPLVQTLARAPADTTIHSAKS